MNSFVDRLSRAIRSHRGRPFGDLLRKVGGSALAIARARVALRACTEVGPRARVFGKSPEIRNHGAVRIGADFTTSNTFGTVQFATAQGGAIDIGDEVSVNYGTSLSARRGIRIGNRSKIGPYCILADSELPLPLDAPSGNPARAIEIGHDVWLGGRVTVLPGTRIGSGAVVSAGSVVSGDVPPNAVVAGNPARVLRITSGPPPSGARLRSSERTTESPTLVMEIADVASVRLG